MQEFFFFYVFCIAESLEGHVSSLWGSLEYKFSYQWKLWNSLLSLSSSSRAEWNFGDPVELEFVREHYPAKKSYISARLWV